MVIPGHFPIYTLFLKDLQDKAEINSVHKLDDSSSTSSTNTVSAMTIKQKTKVFQTVNHTEVLWDLKVKPHGHLNIRWKTWGCYDLCLIRHSV